MAKIDNFRGEYRWLSNFQMSPVTIGGITYPSSEHAYQALKSTNPEVHKAMAALAKPGEAKKFGAQLELRPDWGSLRLVIMEAVVRAKFTQNHDLAVRLMKTGSIELEEGNTWGDTYWGVCNGVGSNHLGRILMDIRCELIAVWAAFTADDLTERGLQ